MKPDEKRILVRDGDYSLRVARIDEEPAGESSGAGEVILRGRRQTRPARVDPGRRLMVVPERDLRNLVNTRFEYPPLPFGTGGFSRDLATAFNPYSVKGRSLRYLAARIMLEGYTRDGLCFSVAGAHSDCSATYTAANLGIVFSQLGLRTLLVDANLKRPRLHHVFNCPPGEGLATMISGHTSVSGCVVALEELRGLSLVPAGAGRHAWRASRRLGNGVLAEMLRTLRPSYDVIICDAPAMARDYDGCEIVAGICGRAISVLRRDRTGITRARRLFEALDRVGTRHVGSVLSEYEVRGSVAVSQPVASWED